MRIPFVGPSYQARSLNADAQRALNCYLEMDNASPRAPLALYGTPGLRLLATVGAGPIRGAIVANGKVYAVSGNEVWRVSYAGAYLPVLVGNIASFTARVEMAFNGQQVLIVDGLKGYLVDDTGLSIIADPDFPNGVSSVTFIDGYFVVSGDGTGQFYINHTPYVAADWDGTDFATAEGSPDQTVRCIANQRELWLFGSQSIEVWINTGNVDFPFERSQNVFIQHGTAARGSVALMDNTIYWLGADLNGQNIVYKAQGYSPIRISTHGIEREIQGYGQSADAIGMTYQQEGHSFYVLTFPTAGKTWVYDEATQQWHERAYLDPSSADLTRWRANALVYFNGEHVVGDFENGNLYALDLDTYSDNGAAILRLRATQCMESDQQRMFYSTLQVDMETGVGLNVGQGSAPLMMMRYSNDGGHTWSGLKTAPIGNIGQYGSRAMFKGPLGAGRNRVWEISMTDPVKFAVFGALVATEKGIA